MESTAGRLKIDHATFPVLIEEIRETIERRLREKGLGCFASSHEALGIVAEEYHELIHAVERNDIYGVDKEMLDIAVAAILSIMSRRSGGMGW